MCFDFVVVNGYKCKVCICWEDKDGNSFIKWFIVNRICLLFDFIFFDYSMCLFKIEENK